MEIIIQGKNLEITESIRLYVEKVVRRKFKRISKRVLVIRVYLENIARKTGDNNRAIAKFKIDLPKKVVVVKRTANDLYKAIKDGADRSARAVKKIKQKRTHTKRLAGVR
jgi:putative sigma-54 modulation protein